MREVSLSKEVVQLKNTSISIALPPEETGSVAPSAPAADGGASDASGGGAATATDAVGIQELEALVGQELTGKILALKSKGKGDDADDVDPKKWEVGLDICQLWRMPASLPRIAE